MCTSSKSGASLTTPMPAACPATQQRTTQVMSDAFKRVERKYLMSTGEFERLMGLLADRFAPDFYAHSRISSLYYDTPAFAMIDRSLEKPLYKEKLRVRAYGTPAPDGVVYVELKKKFDGVVYKRRVGMTSPASRAFLAGMPYEQAVASFPLADAALQEASLAPKALQIAREIRACCERWEGLHPATMIVVERDALHSIDGSDVRLTFDHSPQWRTDNLSFSADATGQELMPGQVLMEIKCLGAYPLWLAHLLTREHLYSQPCSKYGRAYQTIGRTLLVQKGSLDA